MMIEHGQSATDLLVANGVIQREGKLYVPQTLPENIFAQPPFYDVATNPGIFPPDLFPTLDGRCMAISATLEALYRTPSLRGAQLKSIVKVDDPELHGVFGERIMQPQFNAAVFKVRNALAAMEPTVGNVTGGKFWQDYLCDYFPKYILNGNIARPVHSSVPSFFAFLKAEQKLRIFGVTEHVTTSGLYYLRATK